MKLSLVIMSCISASAYSAEKPNDTKNHAPTSPIHQESNQTLQEQSEIHADQEIAAVATKHWIIQNQSIPGYVIDQLAPDNAILAQKYNEKLRSKLQAEQRK
jgi:hypothetical protein